jgi:ATP-binding protein involved in chromosome partitioning
VKQFWTDVVWGDIDWMFVDMPPGTGDVPLTVFQSLPLDGVLIVLSPQELVGMIVEKAVHMAELMHVPVLGLVENMAFFVPEPHPDERYYIFGRDGGRKMASDLGIDFLGQIPLVQGIRESGDAGEPVALSTRADGNAFIQLASEVAKRI